MTALHRPEHRASRRSVLLLVAAASLFVLVAQAFLTDAVSIEIQQEAAVPAAGETTGETATAVDEPFQETVAVTPDTATAAKSKPDSNAVGTWPLWILGIGIVTVLGLIIFLKFNAFLALIIAAMLVSLLAPGSIDSKIQRVANAFGTAAGNIAIVIALAAIIGKCMLDSGAADRVVRTFLQVLGAKRAPLALLASGFLLAIPVFFDTVFYLLVPLARSLYRSTGRNYLLYVLAIAGGGAITHTLVPPTPGPLLMAANLNIDVGVMILVGLAVAAPAAVASLIFAILADRWAPIPMRVSAGEAIEPPAADAKLPPLLESLLPVVLPVVLISFSTIAVTLADREDAAALRVEQVRDWQAWGRQLAEESKRAGDRPEKWLIEHPAISAQTKSWWLADRAPTDSEKAKAIAELNRLLRDKQAYRESAFLGVSLPSFAKSKVNADNTRTKPVEVSRVNRELLEAAFPTFIEPHQWQTPTRKLADLTLLFGNANLVLLISTGIAIVTLVRMKGLSREDVAISVENALMSGGVIILITAAGAAFGDMLQAARIGPAIQEQFSGIGGGSGGIAMLVLGFAIAAVLKVAQGSSTVAMIVGSGMIVAIVSDSPLGYHPAYLATSIGSGSLVGSWMNDSGFWIFAKMSGLTEGEALRSWTPLLLVLAFTGLTVSILLSIVLPLV